MKIIGPYPADGDLSGAPGGGGGGPVPVPGQAPPDLMLSFTVSAPGDSNQAIPANAFVKYIIIAGASPQYVTVGLPDNEGLLFEKDFVWPGTRATAAPCVSLPDEQNVIVGDIVGLTRIIIIYSIIPVPL